MRVDKSMEAFGLPQVCLGTSFWALSRALFEILCSHRIELHRIAKSLIFSNEDLDLLGPFFSLNVAYPRGDDGPFVLRFSLNEESPDWMYDILGLLFDDQR